MNDNLHSTLKVAQPPETLREIVQRRLRNAIIEGHFKPGDRLVERPLCDQLGVSRTVIRETIRFLEAEGLVSILPNRGHIVARMSRDEAAQIYSIRRLFESRAAAACAVSLTPDLSRRLTSALSHLGSSYKAGSSSALLGATTDFYEVIFQAAGHSIAWEVVQRLNARISWLRLMTLSSTDRHETGLGHMTRIHDAILSRDAQAATDAVINHLTEAEAIATRLLDQVDANDKPAGTAP